MAKQIILSYEGTEYTLEFTRETVAKLESRGFVVDDLDKKPVSTYPVFFAGAFQAHHRFLPKNKIDEIFDEVNNKLELISMLAEMYREPIEVMFGLNEKEGETQGNADWTGSF